MNVNEEIEYINNLKNRFLHTLMTINNKTFYVKNIYGRYVGHKYLTFFCGRDDNDNFVEEYFEELYLE